MGLLKKAALVVVGKRVFDEARKPHNQRRIRAALAKLRGQPAHRAAGGER